MSHAQSPELGKCPSAAFFDRVFRDFVISEVPLETFTRVRLPRVEGVDYDTLLCDHCGEDGLGEDVIEPYYYSNIPLYPVSAHLDCVTRDTHRMETTSRISEAAKAAMVWTGPDGGLETRTARLPSDWTKFTCAIGAGHNDPEANHSVLGLRSLHGDGDDHMVCRSCFENVEGFNRSLWFSLKHASLLEDQTGHRVAMLRGLQTSSEKQSDVSVSLTRLGELHDRSHGTEQPCPLRRCYARWILSLAGNTEA